MVPDGRALFYEQIKLSNHCLAHQTMEYQLYNYMDTWILLFLLSLPVDQNHNLIIIMDCIQIPPVNIQYHRTEWNYSTARQQKCLIFELNAAHQLTYGTINYMLIPENYYYSYC